MKKVRLFLLFIITCVGNFAYSQEGPFGLFWGENESQITARGVSLVQSKREGEFVFFRTDSAPRNLSVSERYILTVHDRYGLQKAVVFSKNVTNDISGSQGKSLYYQLKVGISEKYGAANDLVEYSGRNVYKEFDEFYQCLRYAGCGSWLTFWNLKDKGSISLEVKGLSRGVGFIILSYEGPKWSGAIDENKNQSTSKDKNAL